MSTSGLVAELERLATAFGGQQIGEQESSLCTVAERIATFLGVRKDEVAILVVNKKWHHLRFLAPAALKHVGSIPLSSPSALAARTVRENRVEIDNQFH